MKHYLLPVGIVPFSLALCLTLDGMMFCFSPEPVLISSALMLFSRANWTGESPFLPTVAARKALIAVSGSCDGGGWA